MVNCLSFRETENVFVGKPCVNSVLWLRWNTFDLCKLRWILHKRSTQAWFVLTTQIPSKWKQIVRWWCRSSQRSERSMFWMNDGENIDHPTKCQKWEYFKFTDLINVFWYVDLVHLNERIKEGKVSKICPKVGGSFKRPSCHVYVL